MVDRREVGSNSPNADAISYNTVFVDTSLDTHLVMIISSSDTVSDFKEKILLQHSESFPTIGGIKIHSLQVKRQGHFYHLPDSMLVSSAFGGSKKTWFLFVEASCSGEDDKEQLSHKPDDASENVGLVYLQNHSERDQHNLVADDPLKLAIKKVAQAVHASPSDFLGDISRDIDMEVGYLQADHQKELSSDINEKLALPGPMLEKDIRVSEDAASSEDDNSKDTNKTTIGSSLYKLLSPAKKRKIDHIENVGLTFKKKPKVKNKKDPLVDASEEVPSDVQARQTDDNQMSKSGAQKTSQSEPSVQQREYLEGEASREQTNSAAGELVAEQERVPSLQDVKEDEQITVAGSKKVKKKQKKTSFVADGTNQDLIPSPNIVGAGSPTEAVDSVGTKRKKMRTKKRTPSVQTYSTGEGTNVTDAVKSTVADLAPEDHINDKIQNDESMFPLNASDENDGVQQDRGMLPNHDPQAQPFESFKPSDQVEAQETNKGLIIEPNLSGANEGEEAGNSGTVKRKKRKAKKSAAKLQGSDATDAIMSTVEDLALEDHINDKIQNDESMSPLDAGDENNRVQQDRGLSANHDPQAQSSESFKPSDQVEAQETDKGIEPNVSGANEVAEAGNSGTVKRKKGKAKKSAAKLQGTNVTDAIKSTVADLALEDHINDKIPNDESMFPLDLGDENNRVLQDRGLSANHDPQAQSSESFKPSDQVEEQETYKGIEPNLLGANEVAEAGNSGTVKRKNRKAKKSADKLQGTNVTDAIKSTIEDLAPEDHINDKIQNDESMFPLDASDENNRVQQDRGSSPNRDPQAQPSESFRPLDQVEAQETNKGLIIKPNLSGANEVAEAGNSGTVKREKRKAKKSAAKLQDKSDVENNLCETSLPVQGVTLDVEMNGETTKKNKTVPCTETELKNDRELSSGHRPEQVLPKGNNALDSRDATVSNKESGFSEKSLDDKHGLETGKSGDSRKKKRVKKPPPTSDDFSSLEHSNPVNYSPAKHFEEDRELSFKRGPDVVCALASKTLDQAEVTVKGSESGFAVQQMDNEDGLKIGKSGSVQKKKRAKKLVDSVCDSPAKHFPSEAQGNQNILCGTEDKQTSNGESRNASTSGACKGNEAGNSKEIVSLLAENDQTRENTKDHDDNLRKTKKDQSTDTTALQDRSDKVHANEVQPLRQDEADKEEENARNAKKKVKKKAKGNQNAAAETQSNSKTNGENISIAELAASGDKLQGRDHQYDTMNTSVAAETKTGNPSAVSEFMLEKNASVNSKSSNPEQALKVAELSEVPSYHARENNLELTPETLANIENIVETCKAGDEGINFSHYFVPGEHQSENTSADKVKGALHSAEAKRKEKKPSVVSEGTLGSNQQSQNKSNTNDNQLEDSPDAKRSEDMPWTKETSVASGNVIKTSKSHNVDKLMTPSKAIKLVVANGSGSGRTIPSWSENNGSVTASSSSSSTKSSKRALRDTSNTKQRYNNGTSATKISGKNGGSAAKSSQQGKSLLSTPRAIFSDGTSGSSGDENGIGNSDANTHTPSDKSSSSGYSDDESELSQDSRGNGLEDTKGNEGGRKNTLNSKFPDPKDMSMDMIFRSSKRFKKAKLTASQSQEADAESQPVEFVPESQAS